MKNILSKIKIRNNNQLKDKNIAHYLFAYDLLEYNFKEIYKSLNVSYFSKDKNLLEGNFVNPDELKYYESIEKTGKNNASVLIKKFKFRVTAMTNSNFSNEIIVSDYHDFDFDVLHHTDYLIKIALVKDNVDEWINSANLNNYDYIFTTEDESRKLLKENNIDSLIVKGNCAYLQFKNILNSLYKFKREKFYPIAKRFDKSFPKYNGYFKVLDSEYFDEEWYKTTYGILDNTDSVIHFLLIGCNKGYDPSSEFSTEEYYTCNEDVRKAEMNALIHYESYGKKENRIIHVADIPQRDYSIISNSPYFDKEWYVNTYEIPDDVDPVKHYLEIGYLKRYNPGPDFNSHEYYQCNNDIKKVKANPLVHYELYGKKEKRKITNSDKVNQKNYDYIANSPYFDNEWYSNNYDIPANTDPAYHYLNIGFAKMYNPGPEFSTSEYYQCHPDVEEHGMNPLLHYEMYGRNEGRALRLSDKLKN